MTRAEIRIERAVAGAVGLGRDPEGRVVLVEGALPGELVLVSIDDRKKYLTGSVIEVREARGGRTSAPHCPHVEDGCGGCDLAHAAPGLQREMKQQIVLDALRRLGRVEWEEVELGPALPEAGFRTTLGCAVVDAQAGYRERGTVNVVPVDECAIAHPLAEELIQHGWYEGCDEVTIRVGAATGERLVIASPKATGVRVPDGVRVIGNDELDDGRRAWYHEEVAGRRWRISARSFFQSRPDGAEALVGLVREMAGPLGAGDRLVDLCAGVGLFAGALADACPGLKVTAVEPSRSAAADARKNLADLDVRVVTATMDRYRVAPADVVVADPPRTGLGRRAVRTIAATGAHVVVLVSCDAAAFGRDAGDLAAAGFVLERVVLVDMFPWTQHTETVSRFVRAPGRADPTPGD